MPNIRPDQQRHTAAAFLETALAYYGVFGVHVQRGMTDNGRAAIAPPPSAKHARVTA